MAKKQQTKADGLARLKADMKADSPARLYLFHGEEHYLRDQHLSRLKAKLLDGPAEEFNYHRFTQENFRMEDLADAVEAVPMMAQRTLVQVDDADLYRMAESQRAKLAQILGDIPDYCTVVMVFDTTAFRYDSEYRPLAQVLEQGVEVDFSRQSQRELTNWIRRHFATHDKIISDRLCEYLTFVTGGTMTALGSEIEKLAAYASDREITRSDIDTVVEPVLDAEIFNITDAISEGNYELALQKLQTLLQMQQEPVFLMGAIGSQLRRMHYARICMQNGKNAEALGEMIKAASGKKVHPYVLQKTMTAARRVSDRFCAQAVTLCLETDARLKRFSDDDQRTLELLLIGLAREARHG